MSDCLSDRPRDSVKLLALVTVCFCKLGLRRVDLGVGTGLRFAASGDPCGFVCNPDDGSISDDDNDIVQFTNCVLARLHSY